MKLTELKGIKTGQVDETFPNFILALAEKHGINISEGMQAKVLVMPGKNYVYRIWTSDAGYEEWLRKIEHETSPYAPKLLSKIRVLDVKFKRLPSNVKVKVLKLEKLTPIADAEFDRALEIFSELSFAVSYEKMLKFNFDDMKRAMLEKRDDRYTQPSEHTAKVLDKHKSFFEFCLKFTDVANDIMPGNVMMRGDVPVLVDPISRG